MRRLAGVAGFVAVAVLLVPAAPAVAGTTVSGPDGNNVVTITVPIDCVGCAGRKAPDGKTDLARYWEKTAETAWNRAFKRFKYCNTYQFRLDIDMQNRSPNAGSSFGRHRVTADAADGRGGATAGWGGAPEQTPEGTPGQASPDGTRYYEFDGEGGIPVDATETVIVHEFGHVIGLGDDRDGAGNVIPGREGTVMVGGARLPDGSIVGPNAKLRIDQNLIDRIGNQLNNLGTISCGWTGAVKGTLRYPGCTPVSQTGRIQVFVGRGGRVTGGGTTTAGAYTCDNGASIPETQSSYGIAGSKNRGSFTLVFSDGVQMHLPIRGNVARGTQDTGIGVVTVTLRCQRKCG